MGMTSSVVREEVPGVDDDDLKAFLLELVHTISGNHDRIRLGITVHGGREQEVEETG